MTGKKGMRWNKPRIKKNNISSSLDDETLAKLDELCDRNMWRRAFCINYIIKKYFGLVK